MQHEPTLIVYLSEQIDATINLIIKKYLSQFKILHHKNNHELELQLRNNPYSILMGGKSKIESFINNLNHSTTKEILEHFCIVVLGQDGFDLLNNENILKFNPMINMIAYPLSQEHVILILINSRKFLLNKQYINHLKNKLEIRTHELKELNDIGIALSAEHDPNALLKMILDKSRQITKADAGSLYLIEKKENVAEDEANYFADKQLRFKLAQCDTVPINFNESIMPVEKQSIAGHVALSGQVLNIADVYQLPKNSELMHNRSFDEAVGYRTKSMLVIPMHNHKNEIIGVLQLINRKKNWTSRLSSTEMINQEIIEFDEKCVDLACSLASQAAVSIENTKLYEEIKKLFEGFIKASVHAIEQRDPTTFGHSERVAALTTALAEKVDAIQNGKYKETRFSRDDIQRIKYASLLHDFGKIGVREDILVKAKKLFPYELEAVKNRFRIFKQATELNYSKEKLNKLLAIEKEKALELLERLDYETQQKINELDEYLRFIINVNEPTVMKQAGFEVLTQIGKIVFEDNGSPTLLLSPTEAERLSIPKGSLSLAERLEIESHVSHTYNFLKKIPWTNELKQIPQIAYAHHEKIDGSGYPKGLRDDEIPIQSKMMTIADIFDALTAWDRPYKKAVPVEKALEILQWEVNDGKIDAALFKIFSEAKLFNLVKKSEA